MINYDYLIENKLCKANEYYDKYISLVNNPTKIEDNQIFEKHHVIPRSAYIIMNDVINNTSENIVNLTIQEHVLAHYYLSLCALNSRFKFSNINCISLICHRDYSDITEDWIKSNLTLLESIRKEQRKLNSEMQIGLQAGDKNPRCKVTLAKSSEIKELILMGVDFEEISKQTDTPKHFIGEIAKGTHWTCREDHFFFDVRAFKKKLKEERKKEELELWIAEKHTCKHCGKTMTEKYGKGECCCSHCLYAYYATKRSPEHYKNAIAHRRSYKGELNPNYGKRASDELREKISIAVKNSGAVSSRFSGHKHSEKSKKQTSESMKRVHAERKAKKLLEEGNK